MPKLNDVQLDQPDRDLPSLRWDKTNRGYYHKGAGYLHRVIMERMLGRRLETTEAVLFRNGNRLDCRRDNLVLVNRAMHAREHLTRYQAQHKRQRPDLLYVIAEDGPHAWRVLSDGSIHSTEEHAIAWYESMARV